MPDEYHNANIFNEPVDARGANFGFIFRSAHNAGHEPESIDEIAREGPRPARIKTEICDRLLDDWEDLADEVGIPEAHRRRFPPGRQAAGVWRWLEQRDQLDRLPDALMAIHREDLARLFGEAGPVT